MSKFNSTKNKINNLWEDNQNNQNEENHLNKINSDYISFHQYKKVRKITLVDDVRSIGISGGPAG